ncbi:MAG TPA: type II secretion system protein [Candidatus Saccharimonadales bacterium]|jgi:prepilin-type N-terminal cleavage/methylation domain-containing protein
MKQARQQRGFTIVETLIVLAVTGLLFVIAAIAVSGEQGRAEFHQAINDVQSEIQQTIDQVAAGDYQNTGNFTCKVGASGNLDIQPPGAGGSDQGSNTGCIFLGKVLQFDVKSNPQEYIAYPIAGLQEDGNGNQVTTLAAATPTAIAPGTTSANSSIPDASVPGTLDNGLTVVSMTGGGNNIGAVAFISSLGSYGTGGNLLSGSQQIDVYPVNRSAPPQRSVDAVDAIDSNLKSEGSQENPNGGVQICFASGSTDQSGLITIGSNGSNLAVTLQIKNGRNC